LPVTTLMSSWNLRSNDMELLTPVALRDLIIFDLAVRTAVDLQ
jgi:hypothetical protein